MQVVSPRYPLTHRGPEATLIELLNAPASHLLARPVDVDQLVVILTGKLSRLGPQIILPVKERATGGDSEDSHAGDEQEEEEVASARHRFGVRFRKRAGVLFFFSCCEERSCHQLHFYF